MKLTKYAGTMVAYISIFVLVFGGLSGFFLFGNSGKLVIYNLGIDMAAYADPNPNRNEHIISFSGFGMVDESGQIQACFKFYTKEDAIVRAPCDGVIMNVEWQEESNDYSVMIKPKVKRFLNFGRVDWFIDMDHVRNIGSIKVGDKVSAGDPLGNPGYFQRSNDFIAEDCYMFEVDIQVLVGATHYAPFLFLDSSVKDKYDKEVTQLMQDLDARAAGGRLLYKDRTTGETTPWFDYDAMAAAGVGAGCLLEKIPEKWYRDPSQTDYYRGG
ncbi:MAG: M23 family metallopeptidase [Firmicutes bacterium]|nr:M23 family metallopeptidase [Bacillota bacterium]